MDGDFPPLPQQIQNNENNTTTKHDVSKNETNNMENLNSSEQKSKRQRSSPNGANNKRKQLTLADYWLSAPENRTNRFEILSEEDDENDEVSAAPKTAPKPPPIYIAMVENVQPLISLLNTVANNEFEIKILRDNEVKIQPHTEENFSKITEALSEKNTQFHTYKLKSERPFNVIIKGLHHSTPPNEINDALKSIGFDVINVANVKQRLTKNPLSMFYVNLKQSPNNKEIYKIENLLYTKIIVEPPRKKREIPQCHKCQRYGHTYKLCSHDPRCVKCAGSHSTITCPRKEKSKDVKCVLCNGNHPANYKGCNVYKELQHKTFPPMRKKIIHKPPASQPNIDVIPNVSYAQIAGQQIQTSAGQNQQATNDIAELKSMLMMLLQQMNNMFNVLNTVLTKMS